MNDSVKWRNSKNKWGLISKGFHWILALYVFGMLGVGYYMVDFADPASRSQLIGMHKSFGVIFLAFLILRFLWRIGNVVPEIPDNRFHALSKLSAPVLYLCLFIMPLSGFLRSQTAGYPVSIFGWVTLPTILSKAPAMSEVFSFIHGLCALVLCFLIVVHLMAALYHHFVMKDQVFKRMWISGKDSQ